MNQILMVIIAGGAVLGGIDRLLGNRLGYGDKFEEGFRLLGPTALSMAGMICLAPALADALGRLIVPFYKAIGVDPSMFGGVFAIDMGGYQMAKELAVDGRIGSYGGIVVSAIFGCTLVFTIPVGMGMIQKEDKSFFAKGIMLGLAAMPAGLLAGGILSGLSLKECIHQNIPVFISALLLLLGLWRIQDKMIKGFCIFAGGIRALVTVGLVLAAVKSLCGWCPVPGPQSLTGMLLGLVSAIPAFSMYKDMDSKGKVAVGAFLVSGTSLLAAHMGFTVSVEPEMLTPLLAGKICGALAGAVLAMYFQRKSY